MSGGVCGKNRTHDWQRAVFEGLAGHRVLNVVSCMWGYLMRVGRQRVADGRLVSWHTWDVDLYRYGPDVQNARMGLATCRSDMENTWLRGKFPCGLRMA